MKTLTKSLLSLLFSLTITGVLSQTSFTLSGDATPLFLKGYALEGGINLKKTRYSFAINQLELPSFVNPDYDSINKFRKSVIISASRFLNDKQTGFHYGLSFGIVNNEKLTLLDSLGNPNPTIPTFDDSYLKVGINVGYFIFPFFKAENALKGIYIEPRIGISYAINKDDILLGASLIAKKPFAIEVPTLNIGYRISIGN